MQDHHALQYLLQIGAQHHVIGGDIGFALAGVGNQGVDIAHGGQSLYVAGEGGAAHTHNARLADGGENFLLRLGGGGMRGFGILKIVVNDHRVDKTRGGVGAWLDGCHRAGDRGVDGDAQPLTVTDLLAQQYVVACSDQRGTGSTDMLLHGDHHLLGGDGAQNGVLSGHFLVVLGMNSPIKQVFHAVTSLFKF